jgi:hypothetical protein
MSDTKKNVLAPFRPVALPDAEVNRYETLPLNEVQEELRKAGIDPAPTIAAVKALVEENLAQWKRDGAASTPLPSRATNLRRSLSFATAHHEDSDHDF